MTQPTNHQEMFNEFAAALNKLHAGEPVQQFPSNFTPYHEPQYLPQQAQGSTLQSEVGSKGDIVGGFQAEEEDDERAATDSKGHAGRYAVVAAVSVVAIGAVAGAFATHIGPFKGHKVSASSQLAANRPGKQPTHPLAPTSEAPLSAAPSPTDISLSPSASPSGSGAAGTVAKLALKDAPKAVAATINVSNTYPLNEYIRFSGTFEDPTNPAQNSPDNHTYNLEIIPSTPGNPTNNFATEVDMSGSLNLDVIVPAQAFTPDTQSAQANGMQPFGFDKSKVTVSYDYSKLKVAPKFAVDGTGVPAVLHALCSNSKGPDGKPLQSPVVTEACKEVKLKGWNTYPNTGTPPPGTPVFNQLLTQLQQQTPAIKVTAIGELLNQLDTNYQSQIASALKTAALSDFNAQAKDQLGDKASTAFIDSYSGEPAKQFPAYQKQNPTISQEIASSVKTALLADKNTIAYRAQQKITSQDLGELINDYDLANPKLPKWPNFNIDDNPDDLKNVTTVNFTNTPSDTADSSPSSIPTSPVNTPGLTN